MRRPLRLLGAACASLLAGCVADYEVAVDLHADPPVYDFGQVDVEYLDGSTEPRLAPSNEC